MKNNIFICLIIIFLILALIGCIDLEEQEDNQNLNNNNDISWKILDCNKKSTNFLFNWSDENTNENHSKITSTISNVSIKIENTGIEILNLKIDFEFILSEIIKNEETEILKITSEKCLCDSLEYNNDSIYLSKNITIKPGEIVTIYSNYDYQTVYGYKVTKWCYQVNVL